MATATIAAAAAASSRRPPPPCWTHDETLALIDSYREKWYSLSRGNLRAAHWQAVADSVAACRLPSASPPKSSLQCRHKIEKLRKRYRSEKHKALHPSSSPWLYFANFHALELGLPAPPSRSDSDSDSRSGGELKFAVPKAVRSRVVGSRVSSPSLNPNPNGKFEKRGREEGGEDGVGEVAYALRMMGDRFMRMERMKMEMAREVERGRMDMELKRTEMILDSQRQIIDAFLDGLVGKNKKKKKREAGLSLET